MPGGQEEMSEPVEDRDVGARTVGQVHIGDGSEFGATWIDHDQPGSLPYQLLQTRADDRVRLRGIGTDEQDAVGPVQVVEEFVPPDRPNAATRPAAEARGSREQLSTLLLPMTARISFCSR